MKASMRHMEACFKLSIEFNFKRPSTIIGCSNLDAAIFIPDDSQSHINKYIHITII